MIRTLVSFACLAASAVDVTTVEAGAESTQIPHGKYLVNLGGCNDCHTPGYFLGKPDMSRFLGGSDVGFEIPGQGVFVGSNITPDKETGIGTWTRAQIVTAIQTGERPDGRILAPVMPWHAFAKLTRDDARAIAAYLQSLEPVKIRSPARLRPARRPRHSCSGSCRQARSLRPRQINRSTERLAPGSERLRFQDRWLRYGNEC